jgi:hypothetical protein
VSVTENRPLLKVYQHLEALRETTPSAESTLLVADCVALDLAMREIRDVERRLHVLSKKSAAGHDVAEELFVLRGRLAIVRGRRL